MSTVSLLTTGGTISAGPGPDGAVPQRSADNLAEELTSAIGSVANAGALREVHLRSRDVLQVSSRAMTPESMFTLVEAVRQEIASGTDGVVVTHGTDTLEETAYVLAMLVEPKVPVVLTGAMRAPHHPGPDGAANLIAALSAAAEPALAADGPVVAQQDEIHLARWVTKMCSARVAAFASPGTGPVAAVAENRVVPLLGPSMVSDLLPAHAPLERRVELLWAVAGADGFMVEAIGGLVDGLVIAGTGAGHTAPPFAKALSELAGSGCPIVLSSRCAVPQVLTGMYSGLGSEGQLQAAGVISAGSLQPLKARLRLIFALSAGLAAHDVFATYRGRQ